MTLQPSPQGSAERGFVLVATLWLLAALATLAAIYSTYTLNAATASHVPDQRLQAEEAIRSGVELAAYQALAVPETARPSHGAFSAELGATRIVVAYQSEAARIDLNAAPVDLIGGLFASLGAAPDAAGEYAKRVEAWRKKGEPNVQNAEAELYRTAGLTYPPRQGPFDSTLELPLVLGLPPALIERALPLVTVYSNSAQIDVLEASPQVLAALPGVTPDVLLKLLDQRARDPGNAKPLLDLLGPARARASDKAGDAYRASVTVEVGGRRINGQVVFQLAKGGDEPFEIAEWRDDFDGPF